MEGLPFLTKTVYKRVRVWTIGRGLPLSNFVEYPPLPPPTSRGQFKIWNINGLGKKCLYFLGSQNDPNRAIRRNTELPESSPHEGNNCTATERKAKLTRLASIPFAVPSLRDCRYKSSNPSSCCQCWSADASQSS